MGSNCASPEAELHSAVSMGGRSLVQCVGARSLRAVPAAARRRRRASGGGGGGGGGVRRPVSAALRMVSTSALVTLMLLTTVITPALPQRWVPSCYFSTVITPALPQRWVPTPSQYLGAALHSGRSERDKTQHTAHAQWQYKLQRAISKLANCMRSPLKKCELYLLPLTPDTVSRFLI